jgi:Integrase core domain
MALWQINIVGGLMLADGTECKVVTDVDDHSRFCVIATVVVRATGRAVCLALAEALRRYGVPEEALTDNGKQFTDRFGKGGEVLFDWICRDNGITHRLTQPASPTTTGKVERFHKTFRREFLDHAEPFDNILTAQTALDTWVSGYNCDRPHQALDMGYPAERFAPSQQDRAAAEEMLPLRLPATLQPADSPQACAHPSSAPPTPAESVQAGQAVEAVREDADTPVTPLVYQGGPLEFDRVVPASGNLAVRGKQFWLGPARAGATVTFWADHDATTSASPVPGSKPCARICPPPTWPPWLPPGAARPVLHRCLQPNPAPPWKSTAPSPLEAWSPSVPTGCSPRRSSLVAASASVSKTPR